MRIRLLSRTSNFILLAIVLFSLQLNAQSWQPAGQADNTQNLLSSGTANYTDVAVFNNIPYVVYSDGDQGNKATVKKLGADGETWETVANAGFSSGAAAYTKIAFNGATPYVVFSDGANGNKATVMKLNSTGTAWELVGNAGFSTGQATYTDFAFADAVPYVVYSDGANGNKATVMTLNSETASWEPYGAAAFSAGTATYTCITIIGSVPYVAYQDAGNKATVMHNNGSGWITTGTASFSIGVATNLAITNDGTFPYVSFNYLNSRVMVMRLNAARTGWQNLGITINASQAAATDIMYSQGAVYLAYSTPTRTLLLKSTGATFQNLGSTNSFTSDAVNSPSLAMMGTTPIVVYQTGLKAVAQSFVDARWQNLGGPGLGTGTTTYLSMAFSGGMPYVAYLSGGLRMSGFDGSKWNHTTGLSGWTGEWPVLEFEDSKPYIGLQGGSSVVLTANGSTWTYVPSNYARGTSVYSPTLKLNNGSQYVAFVDLTKSRKLTVLKSTGTGWETLGTAGFSVGEPAGHKLFFVGNTLYVGYIDLGINSLKPLVKRYNGTGWEAVGDATIATSDMVNPTFASDGTSIYVAYGEKSANSSTYKATLLKYNGSSWEAIGPRQFSAGTAYPTSIDFVGSTPYIAFIDLSQGEKATVMRYTGTAWELVGDAGFSENKVSKLNFGYDGNNKLYAAYTCNNLAYAKYFSLIPPASTNATLSALSLSNGLLSPAFDETILSYGNTVTYDIASLSITPTLADDHAMVQVKVNSGNYSLVNSGTASGALALNYGDNTITAQVTAEDGTTTKTYSLVVNRQAAPPTITYVTSTAADGTYPIGEELTLQVQFDRSVLVTGTPLLALNSGGTARYISGSGSTTLNFVYTVAAGETSEALNYLSTQAFSLNGGIIKDAVYNNNAILTLPVLTAAEALAQRSNLVIDGIIPSLSAVTIASDHINPALAKSGNTITLNFTSSEAIVTPVVSISGKSAAVSQSGNIYTASYKLTATDEEGPVAFTINYQDLAGNTGLPVNAITKNSSVLFDRSSPAMPTAFTATARANKIVLNWAANSETDLSSYQVYGGSASNPTALLHQTDAATNTYTLADLQNDSTMYFKLSAIDLAGNESLLTTEISATPKASQVITFNPIAATTYGTEDFDPQASSNTNSILTYTSSNEDVATIVAGKIHVKAVGNTTITATQAGDNATTAAIEQIQLLTVTARPITLALNSNPLITKIYDRSLSATLAPENYSLIGLANNDAITVNGTTTYADGLVATNKTITATDFVLMGLQKDNYSLTTISASTTGNITAKPLSVTMNSSPLISKTYDGTTTATLTADNYSLTGLEINDQVTVAGNAAYNNSSAATGKNITVNNFILGGPAKDNYSLTTTKATAIGSIAKKMLTVTADNKTRYQGTANPVLTLRYDGFTAIENQSNLSTVPLATTTATIQSAAGQYPVSPGAGVSENYSFNYVAGILEVLSGAPEKLAFTAVTLFENAPAGTIVGTLTATAADPSAAVTFSLAEGAGNANNNLFVIDGNQILTRASLNYEQLATYTIRVRATTSSNLSLEQALSIQLTDINEAPTIDAIADERMCFSNDKQTMTISGISAGDDIGQSTSLQINTANPGLFDLLEVTEATANGKAKINYRIKNGVSGTAAITVTVTDNAGTANGGINIAQTSFNLRVDALAQVTITSDKGSSIAKGETVTLTASGGSTYQWSSAAGIMGTQQAAILTVRPSTQTTYTVTVTNANGCSSQKDIIVSVSDNYDIIKGTNVLTPNGDGINDKFIIKNLDMYPNNVVKIFDRAGRLLYSQKSYDNQWDGTVGGNALTEGTYYYIIDFGPGLAKKKGFITIIRE